MAIWTGVLKLGLLASVLAGALTLSTKAQTVVVDQGADWTPDVRESFYVQDQGSQIMPLRWMQALKLPDGTPFLAGSLSRYGYLMNPNTTTPNVPIGFTVASNSGVDILGMTCSACHTRQITVKETAYRIDGGPGMVDFQSFLSDLDIATKAVTATPAAFDAFATSVLGSAATDPQRQILKVEFETWTIRYGALIKRSLPDPAWGPSRLDAVSMIFNRLAGLDLGASPTFLIADNIAKADAPARYPFLWNAAIQDKTQWPGFADNGNDILGLARNLGEVYGVFGTFHPIKDSGLFKSQPQLPEDELRQFRRPCRIGGYGQKDRCAALALADRPAIGGERRRPVQQQGRQERMRRMPRHHPGQDTADFQRNLGDTDRRCRYRRARMQRSDKTGPDRRFERRTYPLRGGRAGSAGDGLQGS